jgi:glycosyltransferase involved in cell wall biosynthesis
LDGAPAYLRGSSEQPWRFNIQLRRAAWDRSSSRIMLAEDARRIRAAIKVIERHRGPIDLIHAHFYANSYALPAVSDMLQIPYVVTEHSSAFTHKNRDNVMSARGYRLARESYRMASRVMPVSHFLLECIHHLGIDAHMEVLPNPVDPGSFRVSSLPHTQPATQLISTGRLVDVKRMDLLVEAMHLVRRSRKSALRVIGSGPQAGMLAALAAKLGVASDITFLGQLPRSEVAAQLAESQIFVLPSRVETHCLAAVEALYCGLPIAGFAVGALPEFIKDDDGVLVDCQDSGALAAAIVDLIDRMPRMNRDSIRSRAEARFSPQTISDRLARIYREVAN